MKLDLQDRPIVVTGASGGIGLATTKLLLEEGARVVAQYHRNLAALAELQEEYDDRRLLILPCEVSDRRQVFSLFAQIGDQWRAPVVGCVVNAGIWPQQSLAIVDIPEARINHVFGVNLYGALWSCQAFLEQARANAVADPAIVLIGSTAGLFGEAGHGEYSISKAGLSGLLCTLKNEIPQFAPQGRINMVSPGWTATPMAAASLEDDAMVRRALQTMALRQVAVSRDIAAAIAFFLSPSTGRHLSGQTMTVAGGMEGRVLWQTAEIDPDMVRRASS